MLGECDRVFVDKGVSGMKASRPEFDQSSPTCVPATLVDRPPGPPGALGAPPGGADQGSGEREVDLVVLQQGIDTTTPAGKLLFHMLAAVAELSTTSSWSAPGTALGQLGHGSRGRQARCG